LIGAKKDKGVTKLHGGTLEKGLKRQPD